MGDHEGILDCRDNYIAACRAVSAALRFRLRIENGQREGETVSWICSPLFGAPKAFGAPLQQARRGRIKHAILPNEPTVFARFSRCKCL
jgi:hypothetical protein